MATSTRRCPNCQALSAGRAEHCSLCGATLMLDAGGEARRADKRAAPDSWAGPNLPQPAPGSPAPTAASDAPPGATVELSIAPPAPAQVLGRAVGIGALAGAGLMLFLGVFARVPLLGLAVVVVPALPIGRVPVTTRWEVPSLLAMIVTGALAGALVGGLVLAFKRALVGTAVAAALFLLLRVWSLRAEWAGIVWLDKTYPLIQGPAFALAAAGVGGFFGHIVSLAVRNHLRGIGCREVA